MADHPLRPATRRCLGEPLPHQQADRPRDPPDPVALSSARHATLRRHPVLAVVSDCYSRDRDRFLTCYAPVRHSAFTSLATGWTSFDLHVLSTPPAFVLSQDQTLHQEPVPASRARSCFEHTVPERFAATRFRDCILRRAGKPAVSVLPPTLRPAAELTSSAPFRPEGRDDELPALAFCLLFRFQGAVARGTSQTRARCHVPRGPGTVREADVYVSRRHGGATTPGQEKTSMRWCDFLPRRSSR